MNNAKKILLVEDDENDVFFMQSAAQQAGLTNQLHVVTDGQLAIDYLQGLGVYCDRDLHPLPDIILLDLKLPRVPGMEVLRWIRQQRRFDLTVVIILSASHLEPDMVLAYQARANSFLTKPNNPRELAEMLELIDRYWLNLNQPVAAVRTKSAAPAGTN